MRKPFVIFLILISAFCWLSDLIDLLFYFFKIESAHKHVYSRTASAAILFCVLVTIGYFFNKKYPYRLWLKDKTYRKHEWSLFLLVSAPVILLGLFRSIFPDQNFDTYHFELYLQEYDFSENKVNFAAAAIRSYYFPLPERIFALFRHALGYRLGTIFNTFLLVTIIASAFDFIKKFVALHEIDRKYKVIILASLSLFAMLADNTLFIIGSYKPDLIGIPVLLELLYISFLGEDTMLPKKNRYIYFFLLASLTITYKLTYLPYVGILSLLFFFKNYNTYPAVQRFSIPLLVLFFPSIYMGYNLIETGNPIFPFFNSIFHSPLYPAANFKDDRWGHKKAYELFIFPIVTLLDKKRSNEWELYSYRLLFGYLISLGTIAYYFVQRRKNAADSFLKQLFYLSLLAIIFDYSCLITTGYYRYGVIVEVMYGLVISLWILHLNKKSILVLFSLLAFFQVITTFDNIFIKNINLSWHNYPSIIHDKKIRASNIDRVAADYDSVADNNHILPHIDAFLGLEPFPFDGLAKLLNNKAPIYDLIFYGRTTDSINAFDKRVVHEKTLTKNVFVVATNESLHNGTIENLNKKGYMVTEMHEVYPKFLLPGEPLFLLKVRYFNTDTFTIRSNMAELKEENTPETRNDFNYTSKNKVTAFIREVPYVFNWTSLPLKFDLTINGIQYKTTDRFRGKKIFTIEDYSITVHKTEIVPFMIITQEAERKK